LHRALGALPLLALTCCVVVAAGVFAASIVVVRVTSEGLNIRARPSPASDVVGYLERGESLVATIGNADGWMLVRSRTGKVGYISARFVELVRVVAVDGDPVPGRAPGGDPVPGRAPGGDPVPGRAPGGDPVPGRAPAGDPRAADAGPCGEQAGDVAVEVSSAHFVCEDDPFGGGIASCDAGFTVDARSTCAVRMYRHVECEARLTIRAVGAGIGETVVAGAGAVMVLEHGTGSAEVALRWRPPPDAAPIESARLETGSCVLR
jgi:hypothetical protein